MRKAYDQARYTGIGREEAIIRVLETLPLGHIQRLKAEAKADMDREAEHIRSNGRDKPSPRQTD
jgi:hypothetical protein